VPQSRSGRGGEEKFYLTTIQKIQGQVVSNQTAGYEKLIENNLAESGRGLFQGTT
jgi:hypothetical protein